MQYVDAASETVVAPDASDSGVNIVALRALAGAATKLHFTTSTEISSNPAPPVDVTVTDVNVVRGIFMETISQPFAPQGKHSCPADYGVVYHLVFTSGVTSTTADIKPTGCQEIVLDGSLVLWLEQSAQNYWPDLAKALGIAESEIYPYKRP